MHQNVHVGMPSIINPVFVILLCVCVCVCVCVLQCTRKGALDAFFTQLFESPRAVAAVGAGCSIATEALAEVAHYYNFSVVRKINPHFLSVVQMSKYTCIW